MAISRVKNWVSGEVLTASDLNGEFNNLLNNALAFLSPLTGTLDFSENQATNLRLENRTTFPALGNPGRVYWRTDTNAMYGDTGSATAYIPSIQAVATGMLIVGAAATGFGSLTVGTNGTVLAADSTQTYGIKWTTQASVNPIAVHVFS